ncbi:amidohydrolase family protein [Thermodesulfobacteriota bacterium]
MIIDFHTHIFPSFFRDKKEIFFSEEPSFENLYCSPKSRLAGNKELLGDMDEEGVGKSIVFGFPWKKADHFRRHNEYIIESVQQYPDRLIGFGCFDLLSRQAPKEAERCLNAGLSGIGELAVYDSGFSPDVIAALDDIMAICSQRDVPILLHTNEPVGHQYPGKQPMTLGQLYDLLNRYPSNRIVLAHWGGGLFFYMLMKKEVREALSNVWFDTAASPYLYTPDIYRVAVDIMGSEKIIFGSDYPLLMPGRYLKEMESLSLSPETINRLLGKNASQLLKL